MKIDKKNSNHFTADTGKVFRRKSDGKVFGKELWLGYLHYDEMGRRLNPPVFENIEYYEEVDAPEEEESVEVEESNVKEDGRDNESDSI